MPSTLGEPNATAIAFFLCFIALFLFLTWQSLGTRKWRGVR